MKFLDFALISGKLKRLPRTGWILSNVNEPESVAEHSFRTALLAMIFAPKVGADPLKAMQIALIHDVAETEIGDIVVERGDTILVHPDEKHEKEWQAMAKISEGIEYPELLELFDEYEQQQTVEAKLVKQLDRLEMAIQAYEYEKEQKLDLEEFFFSVRRDVEDPALRVILDQIEKLRE